jgi:hypothetical protein
MALSRKSAELLHSLAGSSGRIRPPISKPNKKESQPRAAICHSLASNADFTNKILAQGLSIFFTIHR